MKKRILVMLLALCLAANLIPAAFAATTDAVIDPNKTGSLTIYKYDLTSAVADGVWGQESYVSTGVYDPTVNGTLADYAIPGVEFSFLKVADLKTYTAGGQVSLLYGLDKADELLTILGLEAADRVSGADSGDTWYFTSDALIAAMKATLETNITAAKNAFEDYISADGTAMAVTDAAGKTEAKDLPLGLYLVVETAVPSMVTTTTNPFFVSVPMTTVNGTNATNGGTAWMYDITIAAKNETGKATLDKTVKESDAEGFVHSVSTAIGTTVSYKLTSRLPIITNQATYIGQFTITDALAAGLTFAKDDVVLTFYEDAACTEQIALWTADEKFTVTYTPGTDGTEVMTIQFTDAGLEEMNASTEVWSNGVDSGYSGCYMTVTYSAELNSGAVLGDAGNGNTAELTWARVNADPENESDHAHVHTYGLDLTKFFSDNNGNFANVNFVLQNGAGLWITAERDADTGLWIVTGTAAAEADATVLIPDEDGRIVLKGLDAGTYQLTETKTDNGYVLLKEAVSLTVSAEADTAGNLVATGLIGNDAAPMTNGMIVLSVVNNKAFDMPSTGVDGTMLITTAGILMIVSAAGILVILCNNKKKQ